LDEELRVHGRARYQAKTLIAEEEIRNAASNAHRGAHILLCVGAAEEDVSLPDLVIAVDFNARRHRLVLI